MFQFSFIARNSIAKRFIANWSRRKSLQYFNNHIEDFYAFMENLKTRTGHVTFKEAYFLEYLTFLLRTKESFQMMILAV